jgi:hypothetical protein
MKTRTPSPLRSAWLLMLAGCLAAPAAAFDLVTAAEVLADLAAPPTPRTRSLPAPGAPTIELLSPGLGKGITSPLDIRLRWQAQDGATIDPDSVRVRYGRFGLDVTSRVLAAARIGTTGIEAPGAKLPAGEHRLAIEVADSQKRVGRREFVVEVLP